MRLTDERLGEVRREGGTGSGFRQMDAVTTHLNQEILPEYHQLPIGRGEKKTNYYLAHEYIIWKEAPKLQKYPSYTHETTDPNRSHLKKFEQLQMESTWYF